MKQILLVMITIAGFNLASQAQSFGFSETDLFLEGGFSFSSNDNKNTERRTTELSFTPKVGYFLSDKAAVGVQLAYGQSKRTDYSGSEDTYLLTNGVGVGVFGRYYFLEAGARFKVYGEAAVGYYSEGGETKTSLTTTKHDKTNTIGAGAGIGANFFVTEKIAVGYQFSNLISYTSTKVDASGAKATNNFNANLNSFENFFSTGQFSLTFKL